MWNAEGGIIKKDEFFDNYQQPTKINQ